MTACWWVSPGSDKCKDRILVRRQRICYYIFVANVASKLNSWLKRFVQHSSDFSLQSDFFKRFYSSLLASYARFSWMQECISGPTTTQLLHFSGNVASKLDVWSEEVWATRLRVQLTDWLQSRSYGSLLVDYARLIRMQEWNSDPKTTYLHSRGNIPNKLDIRE